MFARNGNQILATLTLPGHSKKLDYTLCRGYKSSFIFFEKYMPLWIKV